MERHNYLKQINAQPQQQPIKLSREQEIKILEIISQNVPQAGERSYKVIDWYHIAAIALCAAALASVISLY